MKKGFMSPVERAQAAIAELEAQQAGGTPPVSSEASEVTPPVEASQTPAAPAPAAPEVAPEMPLNQPTEDPNGDTYKARWETLKGMYRTLNEEKAVLVQRVNALEAQLADLQRSPASQTNAEPATVDSLLDQLTDAVGADLALAIREFVQGSLQSQIAPVAQKVEHVEAETTQSKQQAFEAALTGMAPGWRAAIQNPDWDIWLNSHREPLSGLTYGECFNRANNAWDLDGLAKLFNAFAASQNPIPASNLNPNPAPQTPAVDPRLALVTPNRSGGSSTETAPVERFFKTSEVNAFYKDVALGRYAGREQERAALEAEIMVANRAGRIIPG